MMLKLNCNSYTEKLMAFLQYQRNCDIQMGSNGFKFKLKMLLKSFDDTTRDNFQEMTGVVKKRDFVVG